MLLLLEQNLDLFFGASSETATYVYARAPRPAAAVTAELIGQITGPFCQNTRTLPATAAFQDLGSGATLLARAVVPDLCPWTSEQPHVYRVQLAIRSSAGITDRVERQWGVTRFGTRGADFVWDSVRWVARGFPRGDSHAAINLWREHAAVLWADDPPEELCAQSTELGVPIFAVVHGDPQQIVQRLKVLARWPAVLVAIVSGDLPAGYAPADEIPNLPLAAMLHGPASVPQWARVAVCDESLLRAKPFSDQLPHLPVIALRRKTRHFDVSELRRECDHLQRDLAQVGQFAGYFLW